MTDSQRRYAKSLRGRVANQLHKLSPKGFATRTRSVRARRILRRKFIDGLKLAAGCVDCGYADHPAALHFDHLPGRGKKYNVGNMVNTGEAAILKEVAKCEVVCANCHAIRTHNRRVESGVAIAAPQ